MDDNGVIVLLSGGQDSTTCLLWALRNYKNVETVSFFYGQRHVKELDAARRIAALLRVKNTILGIPSLGQIGNTALIDQSKPIETKPGSLPTSYVPGRNLLFVTTAAAYARSIGFEAVCIGASEADYSGYPDCRGQTLRLLELTLQAGMDWPEFKLLAPLLYITKVEEIKWMKSWGPTAWLVLGMTWTCYEGGKEPCGVCPACMLRAEAFLEAGEIDPAVEAQDEFRLHGTLEGAGGEGADAGNAVAGDTRDLPLSE